MNGTAVTAREYVGPVALDYALVGTADFNGDGRADLLWRHQTSGDLWLWQMDGAAVKAVTWIAAISPE